MEKRKDVRMVQEGKLIAVIVGIDGYKALRSLHCAVNDAVSLSETFKKVWSECEITTLVWPQVEKSWKQEKGWGIRLPEDAGNVTRQRILDNIKTNIARCKENDTFIFYFSGHGVFIDEEPALITIANGKTAEGISHIKISDLQKAAAVGVCKKKVMILDCCQDSVDRDAAMKGYKNLKDISDDWWIFLSCSPGERSLEDLYEGKISDDYLQQGIFTASLVEGLRGEAGGSEDGVTLAQLAAYVGERVPIIYQEKLMTRILNKGEKAAIQGEGYISQNPVLIGQGFAVSGPYQVMMAPRKVSLFQKSRESTPGKSFLKQWYRFLWSQWPIMFPLKKGFQMGGAILYAAIIFLTLIWQSGQIDPTPSLVIFWIIASLGSAIIWWTSISFAAAVNERRWFAGGYLTLLFYLFWHGIIFFWYWALFGKETHAFTGIPKLYYLGSDLFLLFIVLAIYCCNTSQTIIAIAEPLRQENERRDIRQAIRVFEEFKVKTIGVSLYNYVPMVSAKPRFYYWIFIGILIIVVINIYQVITVIGTEGNNWWVFLLRDILALIWVAWLMIWYASAFNFLHREVYKR